MNRGSRKAIERGTLPESREHPDDSDETHGADGRRKKPKTEKTRTTERMKEKTSLEKWSQTECKRKKTRKQTTLRLRFQR